MKQGVFQRAITKWGDEIRLVFLMEVDECDLDFYETHFIAQLNTLVPNGYNADGGGKARRGKDHSQYIHELTDEMIIADQHLSTRNAAKKRGVGKNTIWNRRKKLGLDTNKPAVSRSAITQDDKQKMIELRRLQLSYPAIGRQFGISPQSVCDVVKGRRKCQ